MPTAPLATRGRISVVLALLVSLSLAFVAGCGGDGDPQSSAAAGATPSGAADFVPASAPVYVELSTDVDGPQWAGVFALADRFPALQGLRGKLAELGGDGIAFERDIKPLLGERAGFAVLEVPTDLLGRRDPGDDPGDLEPSDLAPGDPRFLLVAELADGQGDAARRVIAREAGAPSGTHNGAELYDLDDDGYLAVADGAVLLASTRADLTAALDAHQAGGAGVMSGVQRYTDTIAKLPADTVVQAYVDIGRVATALMSAIPELGQAGTAGIPQEGTLGVSIAAEERGLRLKGVVTGVPGAEGATEFSPALTSRVPGDSILYVGFSNLAGQVATLVQGVAAGTGGNEQIQMLIDQLPELLGASPEDLQALAGGEHALVVTPGTEGPGIALALEQSDGARAGRTLDALRQSVPALLGRFTGTALPPWRAAPLANGVSGWELPLGDDHGLVYGVDGDLAIVGSSVAAVRRVQTPAPPLSENPAFVAATAAMPEQVTGLVWVDIEGAIRVADSLGAFEDRDELLRNLRPLQSVAGWSARDGDVATFEALLTIQP